MYVGIDIGGTKTLVATLSDDGELKDSRRFPTSPDYDRFVQDLDATLKELDLSGAGADLKVCAGVPGLLDRGAGIVHALGNLPWRDKPIGPDISKLLGGATVLIENDSQLAGLSEALLIRDRSQNVLYLTVSTGLGGALILDGRIVPELRDMEMGQMPLLTREGKLERWEDFASGRAIVDRFHKKAADITDPAEWTAIGQELAYGLGAACSVIQPEIIILGGSVGTYAEKYEGVIMDYLAKELHPVVRRPSAILPAQRPNEAVIFGCYAFLRQHEGTRAGAGA
jgi:glucokinase